MQDFPEMRIPLREELVAELVGNTVFFWQSQYLEGKSDRSCVHIGLDQLDNIIAWLNNIREERAKSPEA